MAGPGIITLDDIAKGSHLASESDGLIEIQRGFYLGRTDLSLGQGVSHAAESFPFVALSILLEGHIATDVQGMEQLTPNTALITSTGERRLLSSQFYGAPRLRNAEVFVTPEWFDLPDNRLAEDPTFQQMHAAMQEPSRYRRQSLDPKLRDIALSVLAPIESGAIAALRVEARALDLLAGLAASFQEAHDGLSMSRRDRDRMIVVRETIEADPASVASLAALASAHGVSASKLKRDFFLAFSTCIGGFVNEQRLMQGRRLIEEGMSVSQAAYSVGYAHPTNFATAFKRRYGVAPRVLRKLQADERIRF